MLVVVVLVALPLLGFVAGLRLVTPARLPRPAAALAWGAIALLLAGVAWLPLSWSLPIDLDRVGLWTLQHWINFVCMGALVFLGLAVAAREAAMATLWLWWRLRRRGPRSPLPPGRRVALVRGVAAGSLLCVALVAVGGFGAARQRPRVVRVTVRIPGLQEGLRGFRIVQISDLHVGYTTGRREVEAVVEAVGALRPDMVAVTGDLTDGAVESLREAVAPIAGLRARHGVYFVTGNHDYFYGAAAEWVEEVRRLGLTPLVNEHRLVTLGSGARLLVAGVTDRGAGGYLAAHESDPAAAVRDAPEADLRLLLAHQPRSVDEAGGLGFDLVLSGHTHGGQMLPFHALARLRQPYLAGLHRRGPTWVYVSRGTGYWGPPFRTFAPSEITELTLAAE